MLYRNPEFLLREIAGERLLLPASGEALKQNAIYAVNAVGLDVLQLLCVPRKRSELLELLCQQYDAAREQVEQDMNDYLRELLRERIVTETP